MFWRKIKGGRGKGVAQGRGRACYLGQALREGLPAGSEELSPAHGLVLAKVESSRVPRPETQWAGQDGRSARATSGRMERAKGDGKRNQVHSGSTPQPALRILASTWGIWEGSGGFGRGALWSALGFKDLIQPVWRADLRKRKQGREERSVLRLCDRPGKRGRWTKNKHPTALGFGPWLFYLWVWEHDSFTCLLQPGGKIPVHRRCLQRPWDPDNMETGRNSGPEIRICLWADEGCCPGCASEGGERNFRFDEGV